MVEKILDKEYYSISEVCRLTELKIACSQILGISIQDSQSRQKIELATGHIGNLISRLSS